MREPPPISLIVCTRDRAASLEGMLASVAAGDGARVGAQIVIVDNGSTDATDAVIRRFADGVHLPVEVLREPPAGLGRARNRAIAAATGLILFFTDDDCILSADAFTVAVEAFAEGSFDFCGGRILRHDDTDSSYGCNEFERRVLIQPRSFLESGTIQGSCMLFTSRLVRSVGGFDPMFGPGTPWRCDDIDYCQRASWAGFTAAHEPRLVVYHAHGRKPGADIERLDASNQYARGAYLLKHALAGHAEHRRALIATLLDDDPRRAGPTRTGASAYLLAVAPRP